MALTDTRQRRRVVLMVSRESHCLVDLLYRWTAGELDCDIAAVISNHDDLRSLVEWHEIPYHHVPVPSEDKAPAFAEVERLVESAGADCVVLARYMQILPPGSASAMLAACSISITASCHPSPEPSLITRHTSAG